MSEEDEQMYLRVRGSDEGQWAGPDSSMSRTARIKREQTAEGGMVAQMKLQPSD